MFIKIAIVHDWLVTYAGAERVLEQLLAIYPEADLFSVVDFIPAGQRSFIQDKKVTTTFIQNLPAAQRLYRNYLPLMPLAIEQLDLSRYDLIISSSYAVAKGVLTGPGQLHVCYCHSPMRYAWDLQHQYLAESGLRRGLKSALARTMLHYMRLWDCRTANGVDHFIANSDFIASRIKKVYGRASTVIYPPVDVSALECCAVKEDYYLTASRLVPYKRIPLIIEAFKGLPDKKLVVIGDGPEFDVCKKNAAPNVELLGWQSFDVLRRYMQQAKAFVFAAEEDFGIVPVEAQACGTPVIAFGKGGALESIKGIGDSNPTGLFFYEQSCTAIKQAVLSFEQLPPELITPEACRLNAQRFSVDLFQRAFKEFVEAHL